MRYNGLCKDNSSLATLLSKRTVCDSPVQSQSPHGGHDLRVVAGRCPGHNVVHGGGKGQVQVVRLALAQHLGQITLGVYVQHQDFLSLQRKTGPQVIDRCAFANSPF